MSILSLHQDLQALVDDILGAVSELRSNDSSDTAKKTAVEACKKLIQKLTDPRKKGMELMLNVGIHIKPSR